MQTCAVLKDGSIQCWGGNVVGELGDGTTTNSSVPVRVSNITNASGVAGGQQFTCAADSDGVAHCWGHNSYGQLGNNTLNVNSPVPVTVSSF